MIIALSLAVVFGLGWGFGLLTTSSSIRALTAIFKRYSLFLLELKEFFCSFSMDYAIPMYVNCGKHG